MTSKLETQVNKPSSSSRIKETNGLLKQRFYGEDVKLDEKALKQAEELERIAQKAEGIDFGILGGKCF